MHQSMSSSSSVPERHDENRGLSDDSYTSADMISAAQVHEKLKELVGSLDDLKQAKMQMKKAIELNRLNLAKSAKPTAGHDNDPEASF